MSADEVLVVGGTGFLGRKVVTALQRQGKPVRALVRPGSDALLSQAWVVVQPERNVERIRPVSDTKFEEKETAQL